MSDRTSNILLIIFGIPFLAFAAYFLATETSVMQRWGRSGGNVGVSLAEDPFEYWLGVLFVLGPGLWLTGKGVQGLIRMKSGDRDH